MKENTNEMILVFDSIPANEGLARVTAASFCTQLNPTLEEVADLKTAVSEAVTNCIIHGYEGKINKIEMKLQYHGNELYVHITDLVFTFYLLLSFYYHIMSTLIHYFNLY